MLFLREISTSLLLELHIKVLKCKFYRVCALHLVYRKVQCDTNLATVDTLTCDFRFKNPVNTLINLSSFFSLNITKSSINDRVDMRK